MAGSSRLGFVAACALAVAAPLALAPGAQAGFSPVPKQLSEPEADVALSSEAVDSAGDTIAVWEQNSTHSLSTKLVAGRWVAADGSLGPLLSLSAVGQTVNEPRVAVGPSGSAFVAWRQGSPNSVMGRWIARDGTLGPILTILTGSATEDGVSVRVVIDASGVASVAWFNEALGAGDRIEVRRVSPEGALGAQVNTLVKATTSIGEAALPGGSTFVVSESMTEVVDPSGFISVPIDASVAGKVSTSEVGIAFDAAGDGLLAWRRGNGPPDTVAARRINALGVPIGGELLLEPESSNFVSAVEHVAVDSSGHFLVGWGLQDVVNEGHSYARAVNSDGSFPGVRQAVSGVTTPVREPMLALDDRGVGLAAYEFFASDAATDVVQGQMLAADATPLGEPAQPSGGNPGQESSLANDPASGVAAIVYSGTSAAKRVAMISRFMEPPTCASSEATVLLGRPVRAQLACSGLGINAATVLSPPAHGTLGAFDAAGDSFTYTPAPGYQGSDSFVYAAANDGGASSPATVRITVNRAPAVVAVSTPPVLSAVGQSHSRWRVGRALARLARGARRGGKRAPVGTVFSFTLNEHANVGFAFNQRVAGRSVGGRCVATTPKNRRRRPCKRTVTRAVLVLAGHGGANKVFFQGRLSRSKKLAPGAYIASITAANAAGQRSAAKQLSFTIVR